jgi:hypothetical protein
LFEFVDPGSGPLGQSFAPADHDDVHLAAHGPEALFLHTAKLG